MVTPPDRRFLCRLASSARLVRLGRGHEGDHHRGPQFTDCVRMVHLERNVLSHVSSSSTAEVAENLLKAISKVRRQKTALALAEEFVELYSKHLPKAISVFEAGIQRSPKTLTLSQDVSMSV